MVRSSADIYKTVGRRVQALRKARGLTQNELAEEVGIAVSYLVKVEGGTRRVQLHTLEKLAEVLGEPVASLLSTRRPPASVEQWRGEAAKLVDLLRDLDEDDVRALVGMAKRMGARR